MPDFKFLLNVPTHAVDVRHSLIDLVDTPSTYDSGRYLRSTASGVDWATASGMGGTYYHSDLYNLDYASSGHTGFASTAALDTVSGTLYDEIINVSGTLQYQIDTLTFLDLTDTPATYSGHEEKLVYVDQYGTGLEFKYFEWDPEGPLIPETGVSGTYFVNFEGGRLLIGATGNKPDLVYLGPIAGLAFDASKTESCYGVFKIPFAWNTHSNIKLTINFMNDVAQTVSGVVDWHLHYHTYEYGEAYGDKTDTDINIEATVPPCDVGTFFTHELYMQYDDPNHPLERGDVVAFRFYRDGASVVDTVVGDATLLALMFELRVGENIAGG